MVAQLPRTTQKIDVGMAVKIEVDEIRDRFLGTPGGDLARPYKTSEALHDLDVDQVRCMELVLVAKQAGFDAGARQHVLARWRAKVNGCGNLVSMTSLGKLSSVVGRRPKSRRARPGQWQLQDAKARFSEVVRRAKQEGPQHVTVHGREEVVIVGADDFRRLAGERSGKALVDAMQAVPHRSVGMEPSRTHMPVRDVDL